MQIKHPNHKMIFNLIIIFSSLFLVAIYPSAIYAASEETWNQFMNETEHTESNIDIKDDIVLKSISPADDSINWILPAETSGRTLMPISKRAGERIEISVYYSPEFEDIDLGILDSDQTLRYIRGSNGAVLHSFMIYEDGDYNVYIRNNTDTEMNGSIMIIRGMNISSILPLLLICIIIMVIISFPLVYVRAKSRTNPKHRYYNPPNKRIWGPFTLGNIVSWVYIIIWIPIFMVIGFKVLSSTPSNSLMYDFELPPSLIGMFFTGLLGAVFLKYLIDKR